MKKLHWKCALPYVPLVVVCVCFWLLRGRRMEALPLLLAGLLLVFGYLAAAEDLARKRIPNPLVGAMLGAWVLVMVPQLFFHTEQALALLLSGAVGALMGGGLFLAVYAVSRGGLGGGDVKLMAASGLYLGFSGVLPTMLYGSVLAVLGAGVLLLLKRIGRKDTIPLAPFLYAGMVLTMLIG